MRIRTLTTAISLAVSCLVTSAWADEVSLMEELVVTAEFRDRPEGDLPTSISVVRPGERGDVINHLEEVLGQAPNVNFASGASRGRFFQIRGIGERGQFSEPLNSSVGLIVDGVDRSGIGAAATLFDVQQVEILRGPQGTLYGANALAGLINIVTPLPTEEFSARVRLDAGDYGSFGVGGVISGPLAEDVGYRIAAQNYQDDGFMDNDFLGDDDTDNHDETTIRAKFTFEGEASFWQLNLGHIDVDNGYDAFSLDNDRNTLSDQPGMDTQETTYASLQYTYEGSDSVLFEASVATAETFPFSSSTFLRALP